MILIRLDLLRILLVVKGQDETVQTVHQELGVSVKLRDDVSAASARGPTHILQMGCGTVCGGKGLD